TYDSNGNMTSEKDALGRTNTYTYTEIKSEYVCTRANYYDGSHTEYIYDDLARLTTEKRFDSNNHERDFMYYYDGTSDTVSDMKIDGTDVAYRSVTKDSTGLYVDTETDAFGTLTDKNYNSLNGRLNSTTTLGVTTNYTYDSAERISHVATGSSSVDYTYAPTADTISHSVGTGSDSVTYTFAKNGFGNVTSVSVGDYVLAEYNYASNNGLMTGTTYGNGTTVTKQFDAVDRVTDVLYNGVEAYHYDYTANGSLGTTVDSVNGNVWRYEYDLKSGRLARAVCSTGLEFRYTYDLSKDRLTSTTRVDNGVTTTVNYIYDNYDRLSEVSYSDGTRVTYSYDFIDRLSGCTFYNGTDRVYGETYSYETILGSDGITTEETYRVNSVAVSSNGYDVTYSYTYDGWGNITSVSQDDSVLIEYEYDDLCQLIGANDYQNGQYITYTYDKGGNITSKTWHDDAGNSFSRSYSYGDESWGDLLTSYDGKAITYDGVGNMLTYGTRSFSWMMGRRLAGITDTGLTTSYSYDSDGVRTQKTVNGVVTDYILDGGQVVGEKSGSNYISYEYDAAGKLVAMVYNGTKYYYVTNAMGDVLGLMNTSGDMVVNYRYDPYGQVLSVNGSM
ncbi:MAG: hypothetical protein PUB05_06890, partial [Firmicutes bacterium]|nr:hypothetical protein [Bacillota bacterium]